MRALPAARIGVATPLLWAPVPRDRPPGRACRSGRLARSRAQCPGQLAPALDIELPVNTREVFLDRLHGDEQLLGDLAIGAAAGRAARHPQLARGQRPDPA